MTTLQILQSILVEDYHVPGELVLPDAVLTTLGLDSLTLLELMFKIEDRFQIKIVDDPPNDLVTVSDVVGYIDGLLTRLASSPEDPTTRLSA